MLLENQKKQHMRNLILIIAICFSSYAVFSQRLSEIESDYYDASNIGPNSVSVNLTGNDNIDDSNTLNSAIENLSNNGGGVLTINKVPNKDYIYLRLINLKDKVHIKIASDVVIRPYYGGNRPSNIIVFDIGKSSPVRDIAITNVLENSINSNDYFTVELPGGDTERVKFINIKSGYNFKISGIKFFDSQTIFSNIECNLPNNQSRVEGDLPAFGIVKNILSYQNHVGYGVVQIRAGKNILFKNMDGEGGITLRIESGIPAVIQTAEATINNVVGRDLIVRNGDAVAVLSPHRINQGKVDLSRIEAYNSTHAIQIASGFLDNKGGVDNYGVFSSDSYIDQITNVSGGFGAQVKNKDVKLYPCSYRQQLNDDNGNDSGGESTVSYSLTVVRQGADSTNGNCTNGCYDTNLALPNANDVSGTALGINKMVVYLGTDDITCPPLSINKHNKIGLEIYPNPTNDAINIKFNNYVPNKLSLIDSRGRKIKEYDTINNALKKIRLNISHLAEGLYFLLADTYSYKIIKTN